jgi:hypothetical protein
MRFISFSQKTEIISLNSINHLIFVMARSCVLFEVRTEFYILKQLWFQSGNIGV